MMVLMSASASAVEVEIGGLWYEVVSKVKEAKVIQYKNDIKYSGNIVIPENVEYEGESFSVTAILDHAFEYCTGLTSITIQEGIRDIGEFAFYGCRGLKTIYIPNSLQSIDGRAFQECTGLQSVHISNIEAWCKIYFYREDSNPLKYAHHLFLDDEEIIDLVIPSNVTSINRYAFTGCEYLNSVHISDLEAWCKIVFSTQESNPLMYAHHLFLNGEEIKNLVIPNTLESIGDFVFIGCSGLTSVTIPSSVLSIGVSAFLGCSSLTSITIPMNVKSIGNSAFMQCSGLKSVAIPNSINNIGDLVFYGCSGLTSITIPNSVMSIGNYAFYGCGRISTITIGCSVNFISHLAFANCSELMDVYCYAMTVPSTTDSYGNSWNDIFENSYIEYATLHVPVVSINSYESVEPWKKFKNIVKIDMPQYTLSYLVDGEIYKTYQIEEGATITPEAAPTKEGYTFSGWSEIPETMPAHDVTVTGTFTINKYKLTYTIDGEEYKSYEVEYGATIKPEPAPTKEGYTFSGWSEIPQTMPAHDVKVTGSFIKDSEKCATPSIRKIGGELEFECATEGVTFKWSYSFNGGNDESNGKKAILAGTTNCHVTVYATKEGYQDSDSVEADVELNVGILGDTNRDGRVTITDAVGVVNIILNNSGSSALIMEVKEPEVEVKPE